MWPSLNTHHPCPRILINRYSSLVIANFMWKTCNLLLCLDVNIHFFLWMLWFLQGDQYNFKVDAFKGPQLQTSTAFVNSLFPLPTMNILSRIPQVEQTHWMRITNTSRLGNATQPPSLSKSKLPFLAWYSQNAKAAKGNIIGIDPGVWAIQKSTQKSTHQTLLASSDRLWPLQ